MLPEGQADRGIDALAEVPVIAVTSDLSDVTRIDRMLDAAQARAALAESDQPWLDRGPWLAWPAALLILLWFRRGWTMRWAALVALALSLPAPQARAEGLRRLVSDPDQQGRLAFQRNEFGARRRGLLRPALARLRALPRRAVRRGRRGAGSRRDGAGRLHPRHGPYQVARLPRRRAGVPDRSRARSRLSRRRREPLGGDGDRRVYRADVREQSDTGEEAGIGADEIVFDNEADRGAETRIEAPQEGDAGMLTAAQWMTTVDTRTGDFLKSRFALEASRGPRRRRTPRRRRPNDPPAGRPPSPRPAVLRAGAGPAHGNRRERGRPGTGGLAAADRARADLHARSAGLAELRGARSPGADRLHRPGQRADRRRDMVGRHPPVSRRPDAARRGGPAPGGGRRHLDRSRDERAAPDHSRDRRARRSPGSFRTPPRGSTPSSPPTA